MISEAKRYIKRRLSGLLGTAVLADEVRILTESLERSDQQIGAVRDQINDLRGQINAFRDDISKLTAALNNTGRNVSLVYDCLIEFDRGRRAIGSDQSQRTPRSHSQYGEDLILWQALNDIEAGFYIDVGAAEPEYESVTKLFYDLGWRGINVEPHRRSFQQLVDLRPRDVNLPIAVASRSGWVELFEVLDQPGLSTSVSNIANDYKSAGRHLSSNRVESRTLAEICADHVRGEIHFLKIDVEGAERSVLEGCDFTRYRPWILAIESTIPCTFTPSHEEWESIVLNAGYEFALFHQINRYYVAREHAERKSRLAPPSLEHFPQK